MCSMFQQVVAWWHAWLICIICDHGCRHSRRVTRLNEARVWGANVRDLIFLSSWCLGGKCHRCGWAVEDCKDELAWSTFIKSFINISNISICLQMRTHVDTLDWAPGSDGRLQQPVLAHVWTCLNSSGCSQVFAFILCAVNSWTHLAKDGDHLSMVKLNKHHGRKQLPNTA